MVLALGVFSLRMRRNEGRSDAGKKKEPKGREKEKEKEKGVLTCAKSAGEAVWGVWSAAMIGDSEASERDGPAEGIDEI